MISGPFAPYARIRDGDHEIYIYRRIPRAAWWIAAYAAVLELCRHGRPLAFLAGVALASALSAASSTVTLSPIVDGAAVRAAHARPLAGEGLPATTADEARAYSEPARANYSHADDPTPAASETASAPQPSPREDPPAHVVLGDEQPDVEAILRAAASEFGVDADELVAIAWCESRFDPLAVGAAGEVGVLQFKVRTFVANAKLLGYGLEDLLDVRAQARTAAAKIAREGTWAWTCAR